MGAKMDRQDAQNVYGFTLQADITQTFIGEIPGGFRVDIQYDPNGTLTFDQTSALSAGAQQELRRAQLLTGTDWVSISAEGIATFDTRITIQVGEPKNDPDDRCVISANIRGRIDLAECLIEGGGRVFNGKNRAEIVPAWQKGFPPMSYLPLALSAVFDVPSQGDKPGQKSVYDNCRELERRQFLALGRANYLAGPNSPLDSIRLDFVLVDIPAVALQSKKDRDAARPKVDEELGDSEAVNIARLGGTR